MILDRVRGRGLAAALLASAALSTAAFGEGGDPYRRSVAEISAEQGAVSAPAPRIAGPRLTAPRAHLRDNPDSPSDTAASLGAAPIAAPSPAAPQTLGVSFLGASSGETNAFPPDTMGAAGPSQFLVGVNGRIRTFAKATGSADGVLDADMTTFFNSVRQSQPIAYPRVRFDRLAGVWIVTVMNFNVTPASNRILIAVSDSGTITAGTTWTYFSFQHDLDAPIGDTGLFLDYPSLGVDANGLTIGANIFDSGGVFQGTSVHVVRKSRLLAGPGGDLVPSGDVVAFRNLTGTPTGSGPYAPQGVDNLATAAPTVAWLVGVDNAGFGKLVFRKITYSAPGAWPPSGISANSSLSVPATALPLSVPHQGNASGSAGLLDALDDRLMAAVLRNGKIWTAHNIAVTSAGVGSASGDRDGTRWYEVDVSGASPALSQSGTLFDSTASNPRFYWMPAIMVSGQGHAALGTSTAGATQRINAATVGRLSGDTPGTLQAPLLFTSSATSYNPPADPGGPRRWGDYSYTSLDPADDMTMWTIQEYCSAVDTYGVRVVQLLAPPPATPATASPAAVNSGLSSVSVTVTGNAISGSGFYDPGAGYANRIHASVSGSGVSVNSVTYTSPTSITLDLDTIGAGAGPRTITVTNPDGQSKTSASGIITIATGPVPTVTGIAPTSGPAAGGTAVTLTGTDFLAGAGVTIGGAAATSVNVTGATSADAVTPALSPGTLNDVVLTNLDSQKGTLPNGFFADFTDVPQADIFHAYIETLVRNGVTAGCGGGSYCRDASVRRDQMAVFLLKSKYGAAHVPPACSGVFDDVACPGTFTDWIEELAALGVTGGCGGNDYCPSNPVTRAQMSAFLLKTDFGSAYAPPDCTGTVFLDVPCTGGLFDPWIEDLASRGITGGCGGGNYCPGNANTRGQMAVFLVKTFSLQ
ncbi:MAG TPA: IPT/TIG domain-containing protein [Thermoanaerobaculia bacterium]|nr:IPT/TIG domain-containing protein [Thermoanaerobaculia bacterium]